MAAGDPIRIDALDPTGSPHAEHEFPAMRAGQTVRLQVQQVMDLANAAAVAAIVAGAPANLNTLDKLAAAIADDPAFFTTVANALATKQAAANLAFNDSRLTLSGGNLLLSRVGGRLITIDGVHRELPSAGITLSASGLTPGTLYYIYAYSNAGTPALEASATGHSIDSTTGVEIKTGDSTRSLVGMGRPITGPAWTDTVSQRFVRSWANRIRKVCRKSFTATRSTTSTSLTEINTEIRNEWIQWAGEVVRGHILGDSANNTANESTVTGIGWDGVVDNHCVNANASATGLAYNCSLSQPREDLVDGYHYATLMGRVTAGTGSWLGGTGISGTFVTLSTEI